MTGAAKPPYYIGLLSGTSMDGIDAALIAVHNEGINLIDTLSTPIPDTLKQQLAVCAEAETFYVDEIGHLDAGFGSLLGHCANHLMVRNPDCPIAAIGSHGQTIRHRPSDVHPFTWQIGDPSRIAELTQTTVIADFRRRDIAAGGEGAPLASRLHEFYFGDNQLNRAVINIGGISNITVVAKGKAILGYDTGPGNRLMDYWAAKYLHQTYDNDGLWAASGTINQSLLDQMLQDNYFQQPPPKSTGRELYNEIWLNRHLETISDKPENIQATLMALTVESIAQSLEQLNQQFETRIDEIIICGGGANSITLMQQLTMRCQPIPVLSSQSYGLHQDWVEAVAFAWLAHLSLNQQTGNCPAVTGAKGERILGAIYQA